MLHTSSTPQRGRRLERSIIPTPQRLQRRDIIFLSVSPRRVLKHSQQSPTKERGRSAFPSLSVEDIRAASRNNPSPVARFSKDTAGMLSSSPSGSVMSGISKEDASEARPTFATRNLSVDLEMEDMEVPSVRKELQDNLVGTQNLVTEFSLIRGNRIKTSNPEELQVLWKLFPHTYGLSADAPFLVIRVRELPPAPWPVIVAGVPLFLTTSRTDRGFKHGHVGCGVELLGDAKLKEGTREGLKDVIQAFIKHMNGEGIKIHRIVYLFEFFDVTLYEEVDFKRLPLMLAGVGCEYRIKGEEDRPEFAWRGKEPGPGVDDTCYLPNLRPGVLLNGGVFSGTDSSYSSTSGVAVKRLSDGQKFVTIASHGSYGVNSDVLHPSGVPEQGWQRVGRVEAEFGGADVSLMRLDPGVAYVNETFETNAAPGTTIIDMEDPFKPNRFDKVYMNNPFSGACTGIFMGVDFCAINEEGLDPATGEKYDSSEPELPWVSNTWLYFGNGGNDPKEGSCGGVILTDEAKVLSFYRYHDPDSRMSHSLAASHLKDFGYEIENI